VREGFAFQFIIAHQKTKRDTRDQTSAVCPIVDAGYEEAEYDEPDNPSHGLPVNDFTVRAASAFPVIENGPDEAADACRRTNCEGNARQIGNEKPCNTGKYIDYNKTIEPEFAQYKWPQLSQGGHIKEDMEDAAVEVGSRYQSPPSTISGDGDGSRCPQKKEAPVGRRQEGERVSR
jgi:hypothetical protein